MNLNAKLFANTFGAVYLAVGLIGFIVTGFDGFAATQGETLILFELNPLHNIVHLLVGGGLLAAGMAGEHVARPVSGVVGAVYALVGVVGFVVIGTAANILALNVADNLLHLVTAAVAFFAVSVSRDQAVPARAESRV